MKKIIIASALVLGSISISASVFQFTHSERDLVMELQNEYEAAYNEVELQDLPIAITEAVAERFNNTTVSKAYINDAKEYKLVLSVNGVIETVFTTETGDWINK
ncbi:hypothetical protein [Formosa haliotis]|uniref:hypothetical protein n=1 Tax=Formosa haliotis TaxID=1555194 RepID=UPI0008249367|nr:hypothetical protein [Formosa haliotis]